MIHSFWQKSFTVCHWGMAIQHMLFSRESWKFLLDPMLELCNCELPTPNILCFQSLTLENTVLVAEEPLFHHSESRHIQLILTTKQSCSCGENNFAIPGQVDGNLHPSLPWLCDLMHVSYFGSGPRKFLIGSIQCIRFVTIKFQIGSIYAFDLLQIMEN